MWEKLGVALLTTVVGAGVVARAQTDQYWDREWSFDINVDPMSSLHSYSAEISSTFVSKWLHHSEDGFKLFTLKTRAFKLACSDVNAGDPNKVTITISYSETDVRPNSTSRDQSPFSTIVRVGSEDNVASVTGTKQFNPETNVLSWSGTINSEANKVFHAHQNDVLRGAGDADRIVFQERDAAPRVFWLKQSPDSAKAFNRFWLWCIDPILHESRVSRLGQRITPVAAVHSAPTPALSTPADSHGELP